MAGVIDPRGTLWQQPGWGAFGGFRKPPPPLPPPDPVVEIPNVTYGKRLTLFAGGLARIGGTIVFGPYVESGRVAYGLSFGVPANVDGTRALREIALDSKVAWDTGGFKSEPFTFRFYQGRLDQPADPLEIAKWGADAIAYRPQMLLFIEGLALAPFDWKIPWVAATIGDTTDGADPTDGVNLGTALARVATSPWVGYTAANFATEGITDVVDGLLITEDPNFLDLARSITAIYRNIDIVQNDKLRLIDRGSASADLDMTLTVDDVVSESEQPIDYIRADLARSPRQLELTTIDPDQDYMLVPSLAQRPRVPVAVSAAIGREQTAIPVIMNAQTRAAMVTYALYYAELARERVAFSVLARGYELEPGDRIALDLSADIAAQLYKIVETLHGANGIVQCQAEALMRCAQVLDPCPIPAGAIFQLDFLCPRFWYAGTDYPAASAITHAEIITENGLPFGETPLVQVLDPFAARLKALDCTIVIDYERVGPGVPRLLMMEETYGETLRAGFWVYHPLTASSTLQVEEWYFDSVDFVPDFARFAADASPPVGLGRHRIACTRTDAKLAMSKDGESVITGTGDNGWSYGVPFDFVTLGQPQDQDYPTVTSHGYIRSITLYPVQPDSMLPALSAVTG